MSAAAKGLRALFCAANFQTPCKLALLLSNLDRARTIVPGFTRQAMLPDRRANLASPHVRSAATQGANSSPQELLTYWHSVLENLPHADDLQNVSSPKNGKVRELLAAAIRSRSGKVSTLLPQKLVTLLMQVYKKKLDKEEKTQFFHVLCEEFGTQESEVVAAIEAWEKVTGRHSSERRGEDAVLRAIDRLQKATEPLYANLFVPISNQPEGIKFLVDLRADLLDAIRGLDVGSAPLRSLADSLRKSLAEWFSVGLMTVERITWEGSSASLLEKVMKYEAVHKIQGWDDMQRRLAPNRRLYAFFHPSMPREPLVLLHTALTTSAASSMQELLSQQEAPAEQLQREAAAATTAVFYSISSTQRGLGGVDLGNFLIKDVAHRLREELPAIATLVTLSPVPGFLAWVTLQLERGGGMQDAEGSFAGSDLLNAEEASTLQRLAASIGRNAEAPTPNEALKWALDGDKWLQDSELEVALRPLLLRLCARYLLLERRRSAALDPVANFHLRNGAWAWRLNWRADLSAAGLRRSAGIMINYRYLLEDVDANNQAYTVEGRIAAAAAMRDLLPPEESERAAQLLVEPPATEKFE